VLLVAGCGDDAESGLYCKNGEFYLDGAAFDDCDQCSNPKSCSFESSSSETYAYDALGRRTTTSSSGVVTANCNGEKATLRFSQNGSDRTATCE
jgi:hypothetical protein